MWDMLVCITFMLSGWVFAGWVMYCRWQSNRQILAGLKEMSATLDRKDSRTKELLDELKNIKADAKT